MRIVRFEVGGKVRYGELRGREVVACRTNPFNGFGRRGFVEMARGETFRLRAVRLLAPCVPSKLVCAGLNYRSHAGELNQSLPAAPLIFLKPPSAVIGPGEAIVLPEGYRRVDYEAELAIVVGRAARNAGEEEATDYVLGYTCFNDVTERAVQKEEGQWTRAKGYDTFAPLGPWIETTLDPRDLGVEAWVNGRLQQSGRTRDLIFGVRPAGELHLQRDDPDARGCHSHGYALGLGPPAPGDIVEVAVEGIGTPRNPVVAAPSSLRHQLL